MGRLRGVRDIPLARNKQGGRRTNNDEEHDHHTTDAANNDVGTRLRILARTYFFQAGFVEKKVGPRQYPQARADVIIGSISCMVIVFFIIVCTAATLFVSGQRDITDAAQAAHALIPLAGKWAGTLFAFGLLNASLFEIGRA